VHAFLSVTHKIVPDDPAIERALTKDHERFDVHAMSAAMLKRLFGYHNKEMPRAQYIRMHDEFMKTLSRDFVNDEAVIAKLSRADLGGKISSLISFSDEARLQQRWEQSATLRVITPDSKEQPGVVELDLQLFTRNLGSCIGIPLLYGQDFLDRNSSLLDDLHQFATEAIPFLILGAPVWLPLKSYQDGLAARARLHQSLAAVYKRIKQYHTGLPVDFDANMSDVSITAIDRYKVYDRYGVSMEGIGQIELALLWAQNINTQLMLFWFLYYIYSTPNLLNELRQEISTCGAISLSEEEAPRITAIDINSLWRNCVLLRSSFLETFRLTEESIMFRHTTQDVRMEDGSHQHFPAGSWISITNFLTKHDPLVFSDPLEFIPDRFVVKDITANGQKTVSYKSLRPWGMGGGMCKGRTFAEKQVVLTAACIIMLWDLEAVDGLWKHPGYKAGGTLLSPENPVRVNVMRRKFH
jgi:cytochrome P450